MKCWCLLSSAVPIWLYQVAAYVLIGGSCFVFDFAIFAYLTKSIGWPPLAANCVAVASASVLHFALNRQLNFRNFNRTPLAQARTYAVVALASFLINNSLIEGCSLIGLQPLRAKIFANLCTIPFGFVANRYLTFGGGVKVFLASLFSKVHSVTRAPKEPR